MDRNNNTYDDVYQDGKRSLQIIGFSVPEKIPYNEDSQYESDGVKNFEIQVLFNISIHCFSRRLEDKGLDYEVPNRKVDNELQRYQDDNNGSTIYQ